MQMNSEIDASDIARGERLKQERIRLGWIQKGIAEKVGLRELAWINYEKGRRAPDQRLLEQLHGLGFDVMYLVTGERANESTLTEGERELISIWQIVDDKHRDGFITLARTYANMHTRTL